MEKQIITCFFIVPSFLRVFFFFGFCNSLELLLRFVQCIVVHDMLYWDATKTWSGIFFFRRSNFVETYPLCHSFVHLEGRNDKTINSR